MLDTSGRSTYGGWNRTLPAMPPTSRLGRQIAEIVSMLAALDMDRVRGYFRLFDREALLDEILHGLR